MRRVQELENLIKYHNKKYYDGNPKISDLEYEFLVEELKSFDPTNSVLLDTGASVGKVKHNQRMGSLTKIKDYEKVKNELTKFEDEYVSQLKFDGCALDLFYNKGKLVSATTRGDGIKGEDVLHHILSVPNIPKLIEHQAPMNVFGEVLIPLDKFEEFLSKDFANPRNTVSGFLGAKDYTKVKYQFENYVDFIAYKMDDKSIQKFNFYSNSIDYLEQMGFLVPICYSISNGFPYHIPDAIMFMQNRKNELNYYCDGIVFIANRIKFHKEMGVHESSHNPKYSFAVKFETEKVETVIRDFEFNVGIDGRLVPVAIVDEVQCAGTTVKRVSIGSYGKLMEMKLSPGALINIEKSGDIIPHIANVINVSELVFGLLSCPSCFTKIGFEGEHAFCENVDCSGKLERRINRWINVFEIKDVGGKLITQLIKEGLIKSSARELYNISIEDFEKLDRFTIKKATKIYNSLRKNTEISLKDFTNSIGYEFGISIGRAISKRFEEYVNLKGSVDSNFWASLEQNKVKQLLENEDKIVEEFNKFLTDNNFTQKKIEQMVKNSDAKSFCFTGAMENKRKDLEKMAKADGHIIKSVSKELDYLVIADPESSSSKAVKARKQGIKLISEQEFLTMMEK